MNCVHVSWIACEISLTPTLYTTLCNNCNMDILCIGHQAHFVVMDSYCSCVMYVVLICLFEPIFMLNLHITWIHNYGLSLRLLY